MSVPSRYCKCRKPQPVEHGAGGWLLCERCGEAMQPRLERLVIAMAREVAALKRRVAELERPPNGNGSRTNGNGRPAEAAREQLTLDTGAKR